MSPDLEQDFISILPYSKIGISNWQINSYVLHKVVFCYHEGEVDGLGMEIGILWGFWDGGMAQ